MYKATLAIYISCRALKSKVVGSTSIRQVKMSGIQVSLICIEKWKVMTSPENNDEKVKHDKPDKGKTVRPAY